MQVGALARWKAPVAGDEATIVPVRVYLDVNGDYRLSTTEDADRIIVADGNGDYRYDTAGTVAAKLYKRGNDVIRRAV